MSTVTLRLIRGGRDAQRLASVSVEVAPPERPPFPIDGVALEDDGYLVLGAATELRGTADHPLRVMTAAWEAEPAEPGSVVVCGGSLPLRLHAVVHDLQREPSWREEWVAAALGNVLGVCRRRRLESLALEPLGTVHGRLAPERFVDLLGRALEGAPPRPLRRIWLVAGGHTRHVIEERLRGSIR